MPGGAGDEGTEGICLSSEYQSAYLFPTVVASTAWDELTTQKWHLRSTQNGFVKIQMIRKTLSVISVY